MIYFVMCFYPFQVSIDVVGLVDEWAARFFEELDYVNEGENGNLFAEMMRKDLPQVSMMISNHKSIHVQFWHILVPSLQWNGFSSFT